MGFQKFYAFDAATGLVKRDIAQAALTSDGYVGTQWDQLAATNTALACIVNVEAITIGGATPETYTLRVVGSNQTDRSDARVLGAIAIGGSGQLPVETVDAVAGDRYEIFCETQVNGVEFRYIDLHLDVAGTSPSITFNAYIAPLAN